MPGMQDSGLSAVALDACVQNGFDRNGPSYSGTSLEDRIDPLLESTSRWNGNVAAAAGRSSMVEVRAVVTREMGARGVRFGGCGVDVGPSRMVGAAGLARCGASARSCRPGSIRSSASARSSRQTLGLARPCRPGSIRCAWLTRHSGFRSAQAWGLRAGGMSGWSRTFRVIRAGSMRQCRLRWRW